MKQRSKLFSYNQLTSKIAKNIDLSEDNGSIKEENLPILFRFFSLKKYLLESDLNINTTL
jgi:hypothetical protein